MIGAALLVIIRWGANNSYEIDQRWENVAKYQENIKEVKSKLMEIFTPNNSIKDDDLVEFQKTEI